MAILQKNSDRLSSVYLSSHKTTGEVFTRRDVVDFMLSLVDLDDILLQKTSHILEPSCGQGDFLVAIANNAIELARKRDLPYAHWLGKVHAYDINFDNVKTAKRRIVQILSGIYELAQATQIADSWIRTSDFLLEKITTKYAFIVGNPPYIRIENIPKEKLSLYRSLFSTMKNRADLYIAFFEKTLPLLDYHGKHLFICTDRWTKNSYGAAMRELIAKSYSLELYVELRDSDAPFYQRVSAYPAITLISNKRSDKKTLIARPPEISLDSANIIRRALAYKNPLCQWMHYETVLSASRPFTVSKPSYSALLKKFEKFPTLQENGCTVHVGAATGNNKIFVVDDTVDIEKDRLLPLIRAKNIQNETIEWDGSYIINTYKDGKVIELENYPKLKKYLEQYKEILQKRYIAKKHPQFWYRTIDKVCEAKAKSPKLLIPDIASRFISAIDEGKFFPNNSVYYIFSTHWPLQALQNILKSGVAQLFIECYSTRMANGYYRFQAQHLRKICVPFWEEIPEYFKNELMQCNIDKNRLIEIVEILYGLNTDEREILMELGNV